ncbi:MAG: hypothetical protein LBQ50_11105 [Planctomycetaceae bacterium]|nr:hypothetical protein [Planctomycetaceae bacterium]
MKKILLILIFLLCQPGCHFFRNAFSPKNPKAPPLITAQHPTLEQITTAINRNSMTIRNMTTDNASILVPGVLWPVQSRLTFERPKRLRIQGSATTLGGQELDFGSNDTLFWLWVRRLPGEMWYCRHDQFPMCPVRSSVPIEPDWFIEALGVVEFRAEDQHEGPTPTEDGHLAILSRQQTASGQFVKRTVIDAQNGWVLRQEMYSPQNELVALAISSDHRYDKGTGILYARHVEVQCRGAEGKMTLDLGTPQFNVTIPFSSAMFTMPTFDGYRPVDLCAPEFLQNQGVIMPHPQPVGNSIPEASLQTLIR